MNEFLTGVCIALVPGLPVAAWLTWPRRYSAVAALGISEAVAVVLLAVVGRHPPGPARHAPVIVRPPTAASTPVEPGLSSLPRQARRALVESPTSTRSL